MIVRLVCRSIPERRALLSFKETPKGTNITFDCSPYGACLPCLYPEKVLSPLRCFPKSVPSYVSRGSVSRLRLCIGFIAKLFDPVSRRFLRSVMLVYLKFLQISCVCNFACISIKVACLCLAHWVLGGYEQLQFVNFSEMVAV